MWAFELKFDEKSTFIASKIGETSLLQIHTIIEGLTTWIAQNQNCEAVQCITAHFL